ncbi:iron complex outermembrane receptor protein [Trinickia symbiotica]|uniref:TonB-dependent siderophore receptor n=1 Tax=Trinickia symbiotica TaxID=863227 RepID=A0A2N7WZQ0_9BURK|nr:TonB-dependent receptor [Trinickia symbiotica]PMS34834.1 TonB-dependent siderophore receptor [Trinickia symbiotica]PPK45049.1 iron complex outermembrane receptor protein [Trinickia symbiotica]
MGFRKPSTQAPTIDAASVGALSVLFIGLTLTHTARAQEPQLTDNGNGGPVAAATLPPVEVRAESGALAQEDGLNNPYQVSAVSKTGTALKDLPASVQVIPRALLSEQGATMLRQGVENASGVNVGGPDSKGFFDHFMIRGLQAQVYNDGFSDGDQVNGVSHSLNGVKRIEILEGPGSALFGSGPPGGTINIVHYTPSSTFHFGGDIQSGSFGTVSSSAYVTGPTGVAGLSYRVDATASRSDGFRDLSSWDEEIRPTLQWKAGNHKVEFSLEAQRIRETPDSYGLIYFHGSPITTVPIDAKYSTPFAAARGSYIRPTLTDEWKVDEFLTINNRFSYLHRSLDFFSNGDSASTKVVGDEVTRRQLRHQIDSDNTFDYQLEPVWKFATGSVGHTLLTGFEYQHQIIDTVRATADLPNIADVFAPVPRETSLAGLTFQCDARHSCDNDRLLANFYSLYATDQMDVTDKLKIRAGVRKDWWETSLTPNITVPGRFDSQGQALVAGTTYARNDAPVSWSVGLLYKLLPWMSPYFGVSQSYLANFNSESTQNGIGAPESALQYEAGVKFSFFDGQYVLNTALFDVSRDNVAALLTTGDVENVVFDSQRTKGAEASLDASVTAQWHVIANFTAQHAVITSNPQGVSSVGNHPQGVPAYMAKLWTTYEFSIAGVPGFHVGAGIDYISKTYSDITNVNSIPSYVIANAAFGYQMRRWGVDVNVHNLTNRRYFVAANNAGAYVGEPLSAFVTLHANF